MRKTMLIVVISLLVISVFGTFLNPSGGLYKLDFNRLKVAVESISASTDNLMADLTAPQIFLSTLKAIIVDNDLVEYATGVGDDNYTFGIRIYFTKVGEENPYKAVFYPTGTYESSQRILDIVNRLDYISRITTEQTGIIGEAVAFIALIGNAIYTIIMMIIYVIGDTILITISWVRALMYIFGLVSVELL